MADFINAQAGCAKVVIFFLALLALSNSKESKYPRRRRGSFQATYPLENNIQIGGVDLESYGKSASIPLQQTDLYSPGVDEVLPLQSYESADVNLRVDLSDVRFQRRPQLHQFPTISYISSNAVDKPVQESQDFVPPQSVGTAIIPPLPPPATPVNAAASNVPAQRGAVFLGSGAIGVVDLGGGAYALGSGSIGYSGQRSNPRSSFRAPLLPPVQAAPNLLPAAVPSSQPPPAPAPAQFDFSHPFLGQPVVDQNGYEYLPPNRVRFGDPLPPRPLKTTMAFATPSNLLIQGQLPQYQPTAPPAFGQRIPSLAYTDPAFYR